MKSTCRYTYCSFGIRIFRVSDRGFWISERGLKGASYKLALNRLAHAFGTGVLKARLGTTSGEVGNLGLLE